MIEKIIARDPKVKWKKLPLPGSVKDLLVGRSCFTREDMEIINKEKGYYTAIAKTMARPLDQINGEILLVIIDDSGESFLFNIK